MQTKEVRKKSGMALSQIIILIVGIIAISYAIGSEVRVVSGNGEEVEVAKDSLGTIGFKSQTPNTPTLVIPTEKPANLINIQQGTGGEMGIRGGDLYRDPKLTESVGSPNIDWLGTGWQILKNAGYAVGISQAIRFVFKGVDDPRLISSAADAIGWGFFVGKSANDLFVNKIVEESGKKIVEHSVSSKLGLGTIGGWTAFGIGVGISVGYFLWKYKKEKQDVVTYTCHPWDAPTGGQNCDLCNIQGDLPCSEYQCRSLGQSCSLVNQGTDEEKCVWVNEHDIEPPIISPWEGALLDNYEYDPAGISFPNREDRGTWVKYKGSTDGCVPAFTPLSFGVNIVSGGIDDDPEPAKCKIDPLRKESFDEMNFLLSSGLLRYNHTFALSLPGPDALEAENITIENNGIYDLYVRCQDANGNSNTANFVFRYCVEQGPDTTPPLIVGTNILNKMPIKYEQNSLDLVVYVNEPAECRWSHTDQSFENMIEPMTCSKYLSEINAQMLYECNTPLTGINDNAENKFYFRCKDKPTSDESKRMVNTESYEFTVIGTQPLVIDSVEPDNEIVRDSTDSVKITFKVKTSAGYKEGEAICSYSDTGEDDNYIDFFNTNSYTHSQDLYLEEGFYKYFIKCVDLGGNSDVEEINFEVKSDTDAPVVVRAYKDGSNLRIITNEKAKCVYSTFGCNYPIEEGSNIVVLEDIEHYVNWNTKTIYYIKCSDEYGNQPNPDECSIIVKPVEMFGE
ncbi:MAG: hypothetical protein KKF48_04995 [Nanoarchaeota archaeon]|nr:hypothetical protein [Nanoarchaeota archaeon]MBU1028374.1 hypothetical protein [Nanoarchaeota archaeon]